MIKVILFDLGGVLFTNGSKKFTEVISERYKLDKSLVHEITNGELGSKYREAKMTRDEFWKLFLQTLNVHEGPDTLEKEWISYYDLIEGTRDIIFELAKKYKVYYLSDNVKERVDQLDERFGFLKWFTDGIFSHEVGVRKPNPKIYEYALKKVNVLPKEVVFIDDKESSLIPARQIGISTILFESPEKLRKGLIQLGVL
ncbi:MAG: HAD-superfamily hydrolase, subfamily IA, variant 3 [uncultured bacterium]|uniref:FCP1 homology domain-containing protein n=1 Tax=Candidatus Gottesmanbacteria bacterium RIFCSPLOWO2_01_FULL_43_11b TaxID=1798392 RepID=A0A1F6AI94_9BACT|nr:MAG: HAD-superfamily hydrolase, subfamily IA, variant 3 [uncultured bacterium]OGG24449.1 MAG: hypothetical protein A3A79_04675 [Candidatus Gottesmanbacteria bacterium RIFCSPLOWO2_01_FULL_43_11b]